MSREAYLLRKNEESLQPQSQHVIELIALGAVLKNDNQTLWAHTLDRAATRMHRLEATIRKQNEQLQRYKNVAHTLNELKGL